MVAVRVKKGSRDTGVADNAAAGAACFEKYGLDLLTLGNGENHMGPADKGVRDVDAAFRQHLCPSGEYVVTVAADYIGRLARRRESGELFGADGDGESVFKAFQAMGVRFGLSVVSGAKSQ